MRARLVTTLLYFLLFSTSGFAAKLFGLVTDDMGEPLPFVSVYINKTTTGTTTNQDGQYFLDLKSGEYEIVYRYVGYKTSVQQVNIGNADVELNVRLELQSVELGSVVVTADKDYALEIINKVQSRRKYYLEQVKKYSCDTYIKGMNYVKNIPKSFMGRSINIDGLDSTRSGIVYLSESVSKYYFEAPDKEKEVIVSSKVSGKSQGFTWNSALDFDVNFYENTLGVEFGERSFISPIASTATVHYKYKYRGQYLEDGILVHKIRVIPRTSGAPLFTGDLYIQDGAWRIHEVDFFLTKDAGVDFVDSLRLNQVYIPVTDSIWMVGTQRADIFFSAGFVKVSGNGYYLGVFSNYDVGQSDDDKKFFKGPQIKVEEESNEKSESYWEGVRIVPLTPLEIKDYSFKDSLELVKESKEYKDSVDAKGNKYRIANVFFGYNYRNSFKNIRWTFPSLIEAIQFNTVEGGVLDLDFGFLKFNQEERSRTSANAAVRVNTEQQLYFNLKGNHRFNSTNRANIGLAAGSYVFQFNGRQPIGPFMNSLYTMILEQNWAKIYKKNYGKVSWGQELLNGFNLNTSVEYSERVPLHNSTSLPKVYNDRDNSVFTSNNPLDPKGTSPAFKSHNAITISISARIRFAQKYYEYPKRKINMRSKWPEVKLKYQKGVAGVLNSSTNFDFASVGVEDEVRLGLLGETEWKVEAGTFINDANVPFVDYRHFMTSQVHFVDADFDRFKAMSYYANSSNDMYGLVHLEHHFNRFIFNKLPLLRRLGWQAVGGFHMLYTKNINTYYEVSAGIEHIFKVGRVDLVYSIQKGMIPKPTIRVSYGF